MLWAVILLYSKSTMARDSPTTEIRQVSKSYSRHLLKLRSYSFSRFSVNFVCSRLLTWMTFFIYCFEVTWFGFTGAFDLSSLYLTLVFSSPSRLTPTLLALRVAMCLSLVAILLNTGGLDLWEPKEPTGGS